MIAKRLIFTAAILVLPFLTTGCATTSTLNQPIHERKPVLMSGVRLNVASLQNKQNIEHYFGVKAPAYPLLDLPFSATFDLFALSYTVPVALFLR